MPELFNGTDILLPPGWKHPQITPLHLPVLTQRQCRASVLRLDEAHPVISGNKWFKLQYYLRQALQSGANRVVTFGGVWSNHLVATACACKLAGIPCLGIVRGMEDGGTATLEQCAGYGMELLPVSRSAYRAMQEAIYQMPEYKGACIIPEGGAGAAGCRGAANITGLYDVTAFSHIVCAVGTGTTMAGLIKSARPQQVVMGVNVLKGGPFQETAMNGMTGMHGIQPHQLLNEYHFGGYARTTPELFEFMNGWYRQTGMATDFVYTGKLFYAFSKLVETGFFIPGSNVLLIHSGGLQGNASLPAGLLKF